MVNFEEHFWGEKYNGFDVLQNNFKLGLNASREFAEFIKERSSIEETYAKSLLKLATKCSAVNSSIGTFEPCWKFLQSSTEKLANVHTQVINHLNEVSKTVREYAEQQKEKQKQMKDSFNAMSEAVLVLQNFNASLLKAKELYQVRCQEVEKYRKDFNNLKDVKNAEIKFKKSTEDYKQLVDKRETARKDYQEKMMEISHKLQSVEEQHLTQMSEILAKYGYSIKVERILLEQISEEFDRNLSVLTVENLLQQFINIKQTGRDIPITVEFEQVEMNSMPVDINALAQAIKEDKKSRKKEKKSRMPGIRKKKEKVDANGSVEKPDDNTIDPQDGLQLDEEGYVIRPVDSASVHSSKSKASDSDSDSESDSDDDNRRIQVRIKPIEESKGSNSDLTEDQLKTLTATLTLMSPSLLAGKSGKDNDKKFVSIWGSHNSLNKLSAKSQSNNDLLNIDKNSDTASLHNLPINSSMPGLDKAVSSNTNGVLSASSPLASPTNENVPTSFSISPSSSFNQSVESLSMSNNLEDAPPPLPVKTRTFSFDDKTSTSKNNTKDDTEERTVDYAVSSNDNKENNFFFEKSDSFPSPSSSFSFTAKSKLTSAELSAGEKRLSTVLPPPIAASARSSSSIPSSLPRPKPGQLVPPPASTWRGLHAPAPTGNIPNQNNSISSLTDLLDINFSSDANALSLEKENMTTNSINQDSEDTQSPRTSPESAVSDLIPPVVPRRATFSTQASSTSLTSVSPTVTERTIPIAIAFVETVNGVFKGADEKSCMVKVTGDMTISFPANIISIFLNNQSPVLSFLVSGTSSLEQIFPNKALVEKGGQLPGGEAMTFKFNMVALTAYLKKQSEQGTKASYYNIDILKYQVRCNGMASAPLQLSAYWRCDTEQTDLKIDYKYNGTCMSTPVALNNVSVVVPVDGGVTVMQSKPTAIWSSEHQRCMWKLTAVSSTESEVQALRARFEITRGPSTPVPIAVQYTGEGSTISLLNFDLQSPSYKLSLVKKRFTSGKYIVEAS